MINMSRRYFARKKNDLEFKEIKVVYNSFKNYILPLKNTPLPTKKLIYRSYFFLFLQKSCFLSMPLSLKYGINSLINPTNFYLPLASFSLYSFLNLTQSYMDGYKIVANSKLAQNAWLDFSLKAYLKLLEKNTIIDDKNNIFSFEKGRKAIDKNLYLTLNNFIPIFFDSFLGSLLLLYFCGIEYFSILLCSYYMYYRVTKYSLKIRLPYMKKVNELEIKSNFVIDESMKNNTIVKSFNGKNHEFLKYKNILSKSYYYNIENKKLLTKINFSQKSVTSVSLFFSLVLGSYGCFKGKLTPGDVVMIQVLMMQSFNPLFNLGNMIKFFEESIYELKDLITILDNKNVIKEKENPEEFKYKSGEIEFRNCSFNYDNKIILKDFNLKIKGGETILITGESGIGKSTLFNLIWRLIDPLGGDIFIDNQNLKDLSLQSLRKNISISYQKPLLFNDSIINNLRYGNINKYFTYDDENNISPVNNEIEEEIINLCDELNITNMVNNLDEKFDYRLGNDGCKLSGGEKQRINLIRLFLKNSKILLLDEPTTGLDAYNYHNFYSKIEKLKKENYTILIISHELDLKSTADKVLCLKKDGFFGYDTHDKLYSEDKEYINLYDRYINNNNN